MSQGPKEDLRAVPPRNCQQTVIPSEKKEDFEEKVVLTKLFKMLLYYSLM